MKSLFRDPRGEFSVSKMWTNIAYAVATYVVIQHADATHWEMLLVYMSVVGGSEVAKKFLTLKFGNNS